ncbi:NAD-dependent epimerase/dehydratase family protein [Planctellipticum variicoloris]|uniref:NAD-dependent epimerase/dehydratase family protein n=1 Tax=Planctellipticum variicoloris TaxID=3064265 RepID=UPI0030137AE8|nr:NAD-dependent epimerase/dehydratase family protein [Planctomycetaceae bacterium SH412]
MSLPTTISSVDQLETLLSEPTPAAIEALARFPGDLIILGVAGKMGPTLARMAVLASEAAGTKRRVFGVARFSDPAVRANLEQHGVETIQADLLDPAALAALPDAPLALYMAGRKFGSSGQESLTWAMNAWLPGLVCQRYAGSRILAFSTGNVYGNSPVVNGGSRETDPVAPVGEYAMSCLGRERIFEHFSQIAGTPVALLRLNYACELRYGVLVDLALKVYRGEPVDLTMGHFNVIWQADANAAALAAFSLATSPASVLNLTGPETLSVRQICEQFGQLFGRPPVFTGAEAPDALLNNAHPLLDRVGHPRVMPEQVIRWIAEWITSGGPRLDKPTHFESRDGRF